MKQDRPSSPSTVGWVAPPRYLLRKHCILRLIQDLPPGRVLEIGCGAGDLLATLAQRGYTGLGLELSPEAAAVASKTLAPHQDRMAVKVGDLADVQGDFDLVMAFEVLEHVADDRQALAAWTSRLRERGRLVLSVPAHSGKWDWTDVEVGHYRRYERRSLADLLSHCGLAVEQLWCHGFPLSNIVSRVRNRVARQRQGLVPADMTDRTKRSGLQGVTERRLFSLLPRPIVTPFLWLQMPFVRLDLGTGYIVRARRQEPQSG